MLKLLFKFPFLILGIALVSGLGLASWGGYYSTYLIVNFALCEWAVALSLMCVFSPDSKKALGRLEMALLILCSSFAMSFELWLQKNNYILSKVEWPVVLLSCATFGLFGFILFLSLIRDKVDLKNRNLVLCLILAITMVLMKVGSQTGLISWLMITKTTPIVFSSVFAVVAIVYLFFDDVTNESLFQVRLASGVAHLVLIVCTWFGSLMVPDSHTSVVVTIAILSTVSLLPKIAELIKDIFLCSFIIIVSLIEESPPEEYW